MSPSNDYLNKSTTLRMCRGCLAADVRLYNMYQNKLMEAYYTLLSTAVQVTDELPHYLCSYCATFLLKCDSFRNKCHTSLIVLRKAQQKHVDLITEHEQIIEKYTYLKQTELEKIIVIDDTPKCELKYSNMSTDTDISSDCDISSESDVSSVSHELLDCNFTAKSNSKTKSFIKEQEKMINKMEHDNDAKKSDTEISSLLKKYFDNERNGLLKDFKVNFDCESNTGVSNVRGYKMNQLLEIITHIQYSSKTSNELLEILDDEIMKCEGDDKNSKVIKQDANSDCKVNELEVTQRGKNHDTSQESTNKSDMITVNVNYVDSNDESPLFQEVDVKIELKNEMQYDETIDSEDDIAIINLKPDSKPLKCKKIYSNNRSCKNIINGILKGRQPKKKKFTEELYEKFNIEVRYLSKEQQIKDINDRKESDNYKNGQFKCNVCFKGYITEETYKTHMSLHDDISGKFVCDICQCHFSTKRRLYKHTHFHTKTFTCRECGRTTKSGREAIEHSKWHRGMKFSCEDCGKEFKKSSSRYGHIKFCHPTSEQLVRCEICGDSFNGLMGLKYHIGRTHKEMNSPECYCSGCNTQFYCSDAFKAHQGADGLCITTHKYCVHCGMSFETEELLKEHEIEQQKPRTTFKCDVCLSTFDSFMKLKMHERQHFYPKYRRKYYASKAKKKIIVEEENQTMICEVCGKSVRNAKFLERHYSVEHLGEKPFKCTICSKGFKTSGILVQHSRTHTGERPFKCELCSKTFTTYPNFKRHNLVHTGERPHSCHICGKSFQTASSVKEHIKYVHMKLPMPPRPPRRKKKT